MAKKSKNTLERILHRQGHGARKYCRIIILNGQVTVNGEICDDPSTEFDLTGLNYTIDGEAWHYQEQSYLMLNKPAHYECSHKTLHHPSIYSLLPHPLIERGVQCIGRLDEDTMGLMLMSDDGKFTHRMSSPKHKVPKIYEVHCKHSVTDDQISQLLAGVMLVDEDRSIAALNCQKVSEKIIHLTLAEGKYHQVKRMVAAISNRVEKLKRIQIGKLLLPNDLPPGKWRWLTEDDLIALKPETLKDVNN